MGGGAVGPVVVGDTVGLSVVVALFTVVVAVGPSVAVALISVVVSLLSVGFCASTAWCEDDLKATVNKAAAIDDVFIL